MSLFCGEKRPFGTALERRALIVLARQNKGVELSPFDVEIQVDEEFHQAISQRGSRNCP